MVKVHADNYSYLLSELTLKWNHVEVCRWENVDWLRKDTDDIDVDDVV